MLHNVDKVKEVDLRSENGKWKCLTESKPPQRTKRNGYRFVVIVFFFFPLSYVASTGKGSWLHLFETWRVIIKEHFHSESITKTPNVSIHLGKTDTKGGSLLWEVGHYVGLRLNRSL